MPLLLLRRTSSLGVDVQQSDAHIARTDRLFQFALSIAESRYDLPSNAVHVTDNARGAIDGSADTIIRAGHAIQIFFRIGDAVLHVHLALRSRQTSASRRSCQFTHGFHVHRFDRQ